MHTRVCGHCTVCRDERSLPRSEWHGGDFQWACFNATPQTSIPPSTYRASSFVVKNYFESPLYINRQHFTTAAALCLSTCLFPPLILYLYALNWPEAISAFLSHVVFFFTITLHQCRTKSLLSKWLEWMRGWSRYTGEEDNAGFSCARASFFTLYEMRWPICWMGREEGNSWFVLEMLFSPLLFLFFFFFPDHMTLSSNSSLSSRPRFDSVLFWLSSTSLNFFFPPTILSTPHSLPGPPSPLSTLFP